MDVAGLVGERRIARDDEEPAHLGERSQDILADAVAEIFLLGVIAHVLEGEHRDGRTFGDGSGRRGGGLGPDSLRDGCHLDALADEAKALARDGADQALRLAIVLQGLAHGVDPAVQRRVRNGPVAPDLGNQVVLADDAVALRDQEQQQVEYLRLHGNPDPVPGQLP